MEVPRVHEKIERWLKGRPLPLVLDLERSHDAYAVDAATGALYLDFFGFGGTRALAFNHPRLAEPSFVTRLTRAAINNPEGSWVLPPDSAAAVDKIATVPLAGEFSVLQLAADRSGAVARAVEVALAWKRRRNGVAGRGDPAPQIVTFSGACHGHHGIAAALSDPVVVPGARHWPRLDWLCVASPTLVTPVVGTAELEATRREHQALRAVELAVRKVDGGVAAILVEPIQGAIGEHFFRSELLHALRCLADEAELLLIFDESECGFGATGRWWDWQYHGIKPDVLIFGGRGPVAGIAISDRVGDVDAHVPWSGGASCGRLVDLMRTERVIDIILEEGLLGHAGAMGTYLVRMLKELANDYPVLANIRSRGLCTAVDLPSGPERDRLVEACFEHRLLVAPAGPSSIRFRPALDVTADAIGRAAAQLEAGLKRAYGRRG
jgi:L-lysine 6-transaminase